MDVSRSNTYEQQSNQKQDSSNTTGQFNCINRDRQKKNKFKKHDKNKTGQATRHFNSKHKDRRAGTSKNRKNIHER